MSPCAQTRTPKGLRHRCGERLFRAETAPIDIARQGPLTCPLATFAVAICNGSFTSRPDVQFFPTNVGSGSIARFRQAVQQGLLFSALPPFSRVPNVWQCSDTANAIGEFPWGGANSWRRLIAQSQGEAHAHTRPRAALALVTLSLAP